MLAFISDSISLSDCARVSCPLTGLHQVLDRPRASDLGGSLGSMGSQSPAKSSHSLIGIMRKPLALQAFLPAQLLVRVLHALLPLQEFTPQHLPGVESVAGSAASAVPALVAKRAAAEAASSRP